MRYRNLTALLLGAALTAGLLTGCGSVSYKDGTYTGQSGIYEALDEEEDAEVEGYGEVTLTLTGGKVTACEFQTYTTDGTPKDEEYGKEGGEVKNPDYYNKAQRAVRACAAYAQELVEAGDPNAKVDAISGATVNYDEFNEAVKDALKKAEE